MLKFNKSLFSLLSVLLVGLLISSINPAIAGNPPGLQKSQGKSWAVKDPGKKNVSTIKGKSHGIKKVKTKNQGKSQATKSAHKNASGIKAAPSKFSQQDRVIITNYFNALSSPYQITALPPGIAKNLLRGKPLPPGIEKQYLPKHLLQSLPAYPGYDYFIVNNDVLLVDRTTQLIADVIYNVIRP